MVVSRQGQQRTRDKRGWKGPGKRPAQKEPFAHLLCSRWRTGLHAGTREVQVSAISGARRAAVALSFAVTSTDYEFFSFPPLPFFSAFVLGGFMCAGLCGMQASLDPSPSFLRTDQGSWLSFKSGLEFGSGRVGREEGGHSLYSCSPLPAETPLASSVRLRTSHPSCCVAFSFLPPD